jgi:hypothetical protein
LKQPVHSHVAASPERCADAADAQTSARFDRWSGIPKRGRVMTNSKHQKGKSPFKSDLDRNPGIGQSKGSFASGSPPEEIEGENTVDGDVENDSTARDGVPQKDQERTNA